MYHIEKFEIFIFGMEVKHLLWEHYKLCRVRDGAITTQDVIMSVSASLRRTVCVKILSCTKIFFCSQ